MFVAQLQSAGTKLGAAIFIHPVVCSILAFGRHIEIVPAIWLEKPTDPVPTVADFKVAEAAGMTLEFQDLDELARFCLDGIREKRFVIMIGIEDAEKRYPSGLLVSEGQSCL